MTDSPHAAGPRFGVKLGSKTITGPAAVVVLLGFVALAVGLLAWVRPSARMLASGLLWLAFVVYWNAAAHSAAPSRRTEDPASRRVHTRLLNASILLLFVPVPGLRWRLLPLGPVLVAVGFAIQILGFALAAWARKHLGRNWSGAVAEAVDQSLVQSGPYRKLRHPIYTAMLGMTLGTAVVSGELHALLGFALMAAAYARKIPQEERVLSEVFGADYETYRLRTWALVPGVL